MTKQSPKLFEAGGVNVADMWSESKRSYPGRSGRSAADVDLDAETHAVMYGWPVRSQQRP